MARISVIGTGYLGLTHAVCMASLGHEVIALDIDQEKISALRNGEIPFHEPGLQDLMDEVLSNNRLQFTSDFKQVAEFANIHFICVGTPQKKDSDAADLSQLFAAVEALYKHLQNPCIIVGKSTIPVGTASKIELELKNKSPEKNNVRLVWNPEFLREGFAIQDTLKPDRIVLGAKNEADAEQVLAIYRFNNSHVAPVIKTNYETSELVKVAANAFLATKISFINAFAKICSATGADISVLADAIGHDDRIGRKFLNAGIGFGGGCLPKDIRSLNYRANELGFGQDFQFLNNVDQINKSRRTEVVELVKNQLSNISGKRIAILGAAFKPNSDDIRDSPAIEIANRLFDLGAIVSIYDPEANENVKNIHKNLITSSTIAECVRDADITLHLTEWEIFRMIDPSELNKFVRNKLVIDGRNILSKEIWTNAGWRILYLGKS
jgi:UDPglucose 6-dehydrogenase